MPRNSGTIVLTKSELISWYRLYEMFHFDAFRIYRVIGSAVVLGAIGTAIIKRASTAPALYIVYDWPNVPPRGLEILLGKDEG